MTARAEILVELFKRGRFELLITHENKTHIKQLTALELLTDHKTTALGYGGAAGGGKSYLGCAWLVMMAMSYPGTQYFIGREELKRLRESTLMTFFKVCKAYGIQREKDFNYNGQDHFIDFKNGSKISLLDLKYLPSDPLYERYGSVEFTSGWLEESSEVEFGAWDVLKTRIGRCRNDEYGILGKLFATLNPKKGWTYEVFYQPYRDKVEGEGVRFIPSLVTDNPFIETDYIKNLEAITDRIQKQRLLFGNFDYDNSENALMSFDKISDMFTNKGAREGQMFLSADIAITNDLFVVWVWNGMRVKRIVSIPNAAKVTTTVVDEAEIRKVDFSPLVAVFDKLRTEYNVPMSNIVYDASGIGHRMAQFLPGAVGIHSGVSAFNPVYSNLKAELYYRFADMVNADEIAIDAPMDAKLKDRIFNELMQVKRSSDVGEKLKIVPKADVKKLLGHSPDHSDAAVYRILFKLTRGK